MNNFQFNARHYIAIVDKGEDGFGVVFPDLPGCVAMGETVDEALSHAREALQDWAASFIARTGGMVPARSLNDLLNDPDVVEDISAGVMVTVVPYIAELARSVKANLSIDAGILASIDAAAERLNITRSATVELLARRGLAELV